jgi:hypothetical protein
VGDKPLALLRADVFLPGKAAPPAPAPPVGKSALRKATPGRPVAPPAPTAPGEKTISVMNAGPAAPDETARVCITGVLSAAKWPTPAHGPVRVQFGVTGP